MIFDIFPFKGLGKLATPLFEKKLPRLYTIFLFCFILVICISLSIYAKNFADQKTEDQIINTVLPILAIPDLVIVFLFASYGTTKVEDIFETQLEKLREERIEITHKIEQEKELDIFNTIQLSLNQLNEYYTINKSQARSSFGFSLFAIILGLITITFGIWLHYLGNPNTELSFVSGISGVLLEFIGGAYFFMYKKSLEQVNFFFGQLIKIQDTMLAINIAGNITDDKKKIKMNEKIISSLLKRSLK